MQLLSVILEKKMPKKKGGTKGEVLAEALVLRWHFHTNTRRRSHGSTEDVALEVKGHRYV